MTLGIDIDVHTYAPGEALQESLRSWVLSSWLRSYYATATRNRATLAADYWTGHHRLAERLLSESTLTVATLRGEPDVYVGWALVGPVTRRAPVLHYCYVKSAFRRAGVATAICGDMAARASHSPAAHQPWLAQSLKRRAIVVDPYALTEVEGG